MTARIQVGTASWTDKSLIASKRFYPKGCSSAEDRLRYYAGRFPMVEVDSSYYAMPSARNSQLWAERTPKDFTFNVKAFRLFTGHQTSLDALPPLLKEDLAKHFATHRYIYYKDVPVTHQDELWRQFKRALEPLKEAGRLGAVHFQFAPWFVPNQDSYARLGEIREHMADFDISTEFRHERWFDERHRDGTLAYERQLGTTHVILDMPQGFKNSVPQIWEVTTPRRAIVRLHGRNRETWNAKDTTAASDRFNYDYSDRELVELAEQIQLVARQAELVQVVFNNNYEDQGQRNATTLQGLLGV